MGNPDKWKRVREEFHETLEFIVLVTLHFVSTLVILLSVKALERTIYYLWADDGLKFAKGTSYEFSAKVIFELAELGVMIALAVALVIKGFKLWFWTKNS